VTGSRPPFRGPWIIAGCFVTFGIASGFPFYNIAFFFDYFRTIGWCSVGSRSARRLRSC
jgi:hypothetical protein